MDTIGRDLGLFEEDEDSIVDFITILTSVVHDSKELFSEGHRKITKESIESGILGTINSRSSLSVIDFNYKENNFNFLINQIPDIQEIREAISSGCIDLDDFEILIKTFKSITEMCRPENISILINKNNISQKYQNYAIPKELSSENSINETSILEKKSLFPSFIIAMFDMITKYAHFSNIRMVMFQICREIVNTLISCNWKDDNVLTWLSRPALSDLLISLADYGLECDISEFNENNPQKKKQCCSPCYIKEVILSSILSKVVETFNILRKNNLVNGSIDINIIDNFSLCFSISNHIIQQYHPNCYSEQVNSNSEKGYKSWWILKSELLNLIQTARHSYNKDIVMLTQILLYFLNQIDSSHLTLKKISTKNHLYKNLSLNKQIPNRCFFNEYLYGNVEVDLPACLQSILFNN